MDGMRGYDAWKTAAPPEHRYCCPKCGHDLGWNGEDAPEAEVLGLEARGLLSYPVRVTTHDPNAAPDGPAYPMRHLNSIAEQREHATRVDIYQCPGCKVLLTDDAMVTAEEYHSI
jgi:hypothetical protein